MADYYGDDLAEVDDSPWIREVTVEGWVILTKDKRIRRPGPERTAVIETKARMFCLSTGKLTGAEMADRVVFHRHRIVQRCRKAGPFAYVLQKNVLERVI